MPFNYEQEIEKAKQAATGLREELEQRILGTVKPAWQCCCGASSHGKAKAVAVVPADKYIYQITMPILWTVQMEELAGGPGYSYGLSEFIPGDEVQDMFNRYFSGIDSESIRKEYRRRSSQ